MQSLGKATTKPQAAGKGRAVRFSGPSQLLVSDQPGAGTSPGKALNW